MSENITRCAWATKSELEQAYHDNEWGIPVHDDHTLFKMLCLEGMQAGLSWATILKKRKALCLAFDDFDPERVAQYGPDQVEALLQNSDIIRNRLKINAVINNANAYFALCGQYGSLDAFLWNYVENQPIENCIEAPADIPAFTDLSDSISKTLKGLGFKFVGSTIIYAYMQSIGIVNDHLSGCAFRSPDRLRVND